MPSGAQRLPVTKVLAAVLGTTTGGRLIARPFDHSNAFTWSSTAVVAKKAQVVAVRGSRARYLLTVYWGGTHD